MNVTVFVLTCVLLMKKNVGEGNIGHDGYTSYTINITRVYAHASLLKKVKSCRGYIAT